MQKKISEKGWMRLIPGLFTCPEKYTLTDLIFPSSSALTELNYYYLFKVE